MSLTSSLQRATHATILDYTMPESPRGEPFAAVCVHDNEGSEVRVHLPTLAGAHEVAEAFNRALRKPLPRIFPAPGTDYVLVPEAAE